MSRLNRSYGLIRGEKDERDRIMRAPRIDLTLLPSSFSNMDLMTPVYDQGQTSSCTGQSHAAQEDACRILQGMPPLLGSRLFVYYNARLAEGSQGTDGGAQIRDVLKAANRYGVCAESTWAFSPNLVTIQPAPPAYTEAVKHRDLVYSSVPLSLIMFKQLLTHRYTINVGIQVFESFESDAVASTGVVPMPNVIEEQCLGGHAVLVEGYDNSRMAFHVRNSWGAAWGDKGYFWLPYAYMLPDLMSDAWVLESVEADKEDAA